jgi:hypothetical protein
MYRARRHVAGILAVAIASLGLSVAVAVSATTANAPASQITRTFGMSTVAVSKVLGPSAKGTDEVLLANGATISVPVRYVGLIEKYMTKHKTAIQLDTLYDEIAGNCGTSFVELTNKSNGHPVHMLTGFTLIDYAVDYSWRVPISGPSYSYVYTAGGALAFDATWEGQHSSAANYAHGTWGAGVVSSASYAVLWTGQVCYSGGPVVHGYL